MLGPYNSIGNFFFLWVISNKEKLWNELYIVALEPHIHTHNPASGHLNLFRFPFNSIGPPNCFSKEREVQQLLKGRPARFGFTRFCSSSTRMHSLVPPSDPGLRDPPLHGPPTNAVIENIRDHSTITEQLLPIILLLRDPHN